jgi:hypothetical protein
MRAAFLACSRAPALPHRERVYQRPPPCRACRPSGMAWMEVGGGPAMALGVLTVKQPGVNDSWESKTRIRPSPQPPSTRRMQRCSLVSRPKAPCPVLRHSVRTRSASSRKLRLPLALTMRLLRPRLPLQRLHPHPRHRLRPLPHRHPAPHRQHLRRRRPKHRPPRLALPHPLRPRPKAMCVQRCATADATKSAWPTSCRPRTNG